VFPFPQYLPRAQTGGVPTVATHRVLLLDTETHDLPRSQGGTVIQPRIVSISWILGIPGSQSDQERSYVVRPDGFTITQGAYGIHRINTERARAIGSSLQSVLVRLLEDCDAFRPQMVVAHNASFDLPVIEAEFLRLGISNPLTSLRSICTMRSTVALCCIPHRHGSGFKWPTLQELYVKLFARPFIGEHESASDVRALSECFGKLYRAGHYNAEFGLIQPPLLTPTEAHTRKGYVFECDDSTVTDCKQRSLFGARKDWPLSVTPGNICFLYNINSHIIYGMWRAVQSGESLDATAFGGKFQYQCRVQLMLPRIAPLPRNSFSFLAHGRIPNLVPQTDLEPMMREFTLASAK
jgi:DNA polymerase III epsilon subunit-like protein